MREMRVILMIVGFWLASSTSSGLAQVPQDLHSESNPNWQRIDNPIQKRRENEMAQGTQSFREIMEHLTRQRLPSSQKADGLEAAQ